MLPDGHADYLHLVDYPAVMTRDFFIKGIDYLLVLAERAATAVMCSEGDPDMCHRHHLIGRYLVEQRGVRVLHILGDGKTILQPRPQSIANTEPVTQLLLFN